MEKINEKIKELQMDKKVGLFLYRNGEAKGRVEGLVAQVTVWLLQRDFLVISEGSNAKNPYLLVPGDKAHLFLPIVLGNTAGCHYQSYLPLTNIRVNDFCQPESSCSASSTQSNLKNNNINNIEVFSSS